MMIVNIEINLKMHLLISLDCNVDSFQLQMCQDFKGQTLLHNYLPCGITTSRCVSNNSRLICAFSNARPSISSMAPHNCATNNYYLASCTAPPPADYLYTQSSLVKIEIRILSPPML